MLSRRVARASSAQAAARTARFQPIVSRRSFIPTSMNGPEIVEQKYPDSDYPNLPDEEDPGMNGGFVNPPRVKRQFRDPHADWWDKQERRNFGEPVHEDHDVLGMFTPHEYTWISPGKGALQLGAFVLSILGLCAFVKATYPDKQSYPREFEGGLERELGGSGAVRARAPGDAYGPEDEE